MPANLQRFRFPIGQSRGRRYSEAGHPFRSAFQRDRDRIVHARAFRRLENKTQVFSPGLSDHFRNRLTHTIEVAQLARTAARALQLDEDLTEALALAHDIGHPPFAHAGEEELNARMQSLGDRFEHNIHALRIVESFEHRYAAHPGLNLTFEVREGIVKHSREIRPGEFPELDEYLPGFRPPLEAQLIDPADEIAYNTADLDDGYSAGLLSVEDAAHAVPQYGEIVARIDSVYPEAPERVRFLESIRSLIDFLVAALIEGSLQAVERSGAETLDDIRGHSSRLIQFTSEARRTSEQLKSFLYRMVYDTPVLREERRRSCELIGRLFMHYMDHPECLPDPYARLAAAAPRHRVVCDYIAGMTDNFLLRTSQALLGHG